MTGEVVLGLRERRRVFDTVWMATLVVVVLALVIPWYQRSLDIALAPSLWIVFGYALFYSLASPLVDRLLPRQASTVLFLLQVSGIVCLALVWYQVGALGNPSFLLFFVLPVVASSLLALRWMPYATALACVVCAVTVAVAHSAALRWYLARLGLAWPELFARFAPAAGAAPYPGFDPPAAYGFVTLISFFLILLCVALVCESQTSLLLSLYSRLGTSNVAKEQAETLARRVLAAAPEPAVLVDAATGRIVDASDSFVHELLLRREDLENRRLEDLVRFSYPDVIGRARTDGHVPFAVYSVDGEPRVARVTAYGIRQGEDEYFYLTLLDVTDLHYLHTALDSLDEPHVLLGGDGRIVYVNRSAIATLPGLELGAEAGAVLDALVTPKGWWDLGLRSAVQRRVEYRGERWEAALSAATIAGEQQRLTLIRLQRSGQPTPRSVAAS